MRSSATQPLKQKARIRKLIIKNNLCKDPWGCIVCYVRFREKGKLLSIPYGVLFLFL